MNKDEKEDYIPLRTLIEEGLKNSVDKGIKVVIDKIDEVDKRLRKVEAFVKEAKGKSASTRDVKPSLVEQESEEVALASTANDEATRKRKASDDVIQNMRGPPPSPSSRSGARPIVTGIKSPCRRLELTPSSPSRARSVVKGGAGGGRRRAVHDSAKGSGWRRKGSRRLEPPPQEGGQGRRVGG
ncbi:Uncharacterized protein Rs2_47240 [Raphanus sativus]|nr:Uncharacterized protein Rs2_47240 [Raphanus sativus]